MVVGDSWGEGVWVVSDWVGIGVSVGIGASVGVRISVGWDVGSGVGVLVGAAVGVGEVINFKRFWSILIFKLSRSKAKALGAKIKKILRIFLP